MSTIQLSTRRVTQDQIHDGQNRPENIKKQSLQQLSFRGFFPDSWCKPVYPKGEATHPH